MLQNIKQLYGRKLSAPDGEIGEVKDFYFDDKTWAVRYLVVDTGPWLAGRDVLLSPQAFGANPFGPAEAADPVLRVTLAKKQIEDSPSLDTHLPVSRQYENDYYRHYGWPTYWSDANMGGIGSVTAVPPPPTSVGHHGHNQRDDIHLRSTKAVTGYHLHASDGEIGTLNSFLLDRTGWAIREIAVDCGHWFAAKPVFLRVEDILRISYPDSAVFVNLTREDITQTEKNRVAHVAPHRA
ncbi:MAG: PRC-barrel domain-containing protein [Opitutaceae bacterium]